MTRTRGPPRRPSRDPSAGLAAEGGSGGSGNGSVRSPGKGYRLISAQPPNTTSGSGASQHPPPFAAPLLPYSIQPSAADNRLDGTQIYDTPADTDAPATEPPAANLIGDETATLAEYPYSIYNHGTWSAEDDKTLIQARSQGQNWADLQRTHFPSKTANACRKRYERLVERRGIHDYSGRRLETVANEYMNMRKEIWSGLADRLGMKWEVVEALCMSVGLRTVQSNARAYTNRARRDSRIAQKTRDAQVDSVGVGFAGHPPLAPHPAGTEFGTAFISPHTMQSDRLDRNHQDAGDSSPNFLPPPPFIPTSGAPPAGRLPPMAPIPRTSWTGHVNGDSRSGGLSPEPPPFGMAVDWQGTSTRGV